MRKVRVHIHEVCQTEKPSKEEIRYNINNEITQSVSEVTPEEFALQTVQPYSRTWLGSIMDGKRKKDNYVSSHLIGLDFDDIVPFSVIKKRCIEYNLFPLFCYNSFSDPNTGNDYQKYRLVFALDWDLTSHEEFKRLYKAFLEIFPEADKACNDSTRIFLGGHTLIWTNYDSFISREIADMVLYSRLKELDVNKKTGKKNNNSTKKFKLKSIGHLFPEKLNHEFENIDNVNVMLLQGMCPLMKYLMKFDKQKRKEYPSVKTIVGLLTSLCKLGKTSTDFYNAFLTYGNNKEVHWDEFVKYFKMRDLIPQKCSNMNCPFYDICPDNSASLYHKVFRQKGISVTRLRDYDETKLVSIRRAENMLKDALMSFLKSDVSVCDTTIIKAECGLGKTTGLIEYLSELYESGDDVPSITIACLNHIKKDEISNILKKKGLDILTKPKMKMDEIPFVFRRELQRRFNIGDWQGALTYLHKVCGFFGYGEDYIKEYREFKEKKESSSVYVTTIEEVLLNPDGVHTDIVYFDEDPTFKLLQTKEVKIEDLKTLCFDSQKEHPAFSKNLAKVISFIEEKCGSNKVYNINKRLSKEGMATILDFLRGNDACNSDVVAFLLCNGFISYEDYKGNKHVSYLIKRKLPNRKVLIGSATIDSWVAEHLYCNPVLIEIPQHKKKGRIIQCCEYSLSRSSFNKQWKSLPISLIAEMKNYNVITHGSEMYRFNEAQLKFGNSNGIDTLKNKDLLVAGTYNLPPEIHRLYLAGLKGLETANKAVKGIRRYTINTNDFSFNPRISEDEDLKHIQTTLVYEELYQAIGRSRWNRFDCTVYVLSNYPIFEADIVSLEDFEKRMIGCRECRLAA